MNQLIQTDPAVTMTSREISDLTEKRHDNVKRVIETIANQGVITLPQFEEVLNEGPGPKMISQYRIGKRDSFIIVAQLSPEFTARLVDRWQELESQAVGQNTFDAGKALSDPATLRNLLLGYTEKVQELENTVQELKPKVEAFDRIANTDGSFCIRDAAKTLQIPEKRLTQFLIERKWIYRRPMGTGYLAYADRIQFGLLEHKVTTGEKSDGSSWTNTQARVTAKGLAKLADLLGNAVSA